MRIRFSSIVVCTLMVLSSAFATAKTDPTAAAEVDKEEFPQVADFYQLMKMNEQDRIAYMTGVIGILSDLEKDGIYLPGAKKDYQSSTTFLKWLLQIQSAHAAAKCENQSCGSYIKIDLGDGAVGCLAQKCNANQTMKCELMPGECQTKCYCLDMTSVDKVSVAPVPVVGLINSGGATSGNASSGGSDAGAAPAIVPVANGSINDPPAAQVAPATSPSDKGIRQIINQNQAETNGACQPKKCDQSPGYRAKAKDAFNDRVEDSGDKRCINGGVISRYLIDSIQKCKSVQSYTIGKLTLTCPAGKTICNPLLFGLQTQTPPQAFCVPIGVEMTQTCNTLSGGPEAAKKFWQRADLDYPDLEKKWSELTSDLTSDLCKETASANYHCKECAIIAKRLRELNKVASKCTSGCGDNLKCTYNGPKSIRQLNPIKGRKTGAQ